MLAGSARLLFLCLCCGRLLLLEARSLVERVHEKI